MLRRMVRSKMDLRVRTAAGVRLSLAAMIVVGVPRRSNWSSLASSSGLHGLLSKGRLIDMGLRWLWGLGRQARYPVRPGPPGCAAGWKGMPQQSSS